MKLLLTLLPALALTTACSAPNVFYNTPAREYGISLDRVGGNPVFRTYQDMFGDFYPGEESPEHQLGLGDLSMQAQYQQQVEHYLAGIVDGITSALDGTGGAETPLVILIHGFRVPNSEDHHEQLREHVSTYLGPEQAVYLHLNWDGRYSVGRNVWSGGQYTGPLVGLKFRRLLNAIQETRSNTPIRIVAHSSGAFVIGSMLGNPGNALPCNHKDSDCDRYPTEYVPHASARTGMYRVPNGADIRALMLAPATPGNTFSGGTTKEEKELGILADGTQLIVGANRYDFALSKFIFPGSISLFGSNALGLKVNDYCKLKRSIETDQARGLKVGTALRRIDFSRNGPKSLRQMWRWEDHSIWAYLRRESAIGEATKLLFGTGTIGIDEKAMCESAPFFEFIY